MIVVSDEATAELSIDDADAAPPPIAARTASMR